MTKKTCPHCGFQFPSNLHCMGKVCFPPDPDTDLSRWELAQEAQKVLNEEKRELGKDGVIQLELVGDLDTQKLLLNRLHAQWPWAIEVIFCEEEDGLSSWYIVNLARIPEALGGPLKAVYEVSLDGFRESRAHADILSFFGGLDCG